MNITESYLYDVIKTFKHEQNYITTKQVVSQVNDKEDDVNIKNLILLCNAIESLKKLKKSIDSTKKTEKK
jgi:hypothetical protein